MEHDTEMGRLTNKIIENSPVQSKGYILWDGETKGFGIRININGKKTFILKYRIGQGRRAKIKKLNHKLTNTLVIIKVFFQNLSL